MNTYKFLIARSLKLLVAIVLICTPVLSMAELMMVAKMPGQTVMQIIMKATTCNGGPVALFMGPDGKNVDKTCNVKIGEDEVTLVFAGYGKPLRIPRAQFSSFDVPISNQNAQTSPNKSLTAPQKNAARSAEQYLKFAGFSRSGLIRQLSSAVGDNYEVTDATVAVDSLNIDWNKQAIRSAKEYLGFQGFSCKGLIRQLSSETGSGYTVEEATYGAQQAGACN